MNAWYFKKFKITLLCSLFFINAYAQNIYTGKVVSSKNNETIAGVTILVKGTSRGSTTDNNGGFSIRAKSGDVVLFTYVGYADKEVKLSAQKSISIIMQESLGKLDEVVVIGYGTVKKKDLTGSVASVNAQQLKDASSISFGDALRGKLSGVQVTSSGGEPGAGLNIRIRGVNSISASSNPLFVVDGIPIESNQAEIKTGGTPLDQAAVNPLSYIDPNNIASIEVLKDASAAAIYGSRGANGVILITTKTGEPGKAQTSFSSSTGVSVFNRRIEVLGAPEYAAFIHLKNPENPLYTNQTTLEAIPFTDAQTIDWQDELFVKAPLQNYNASFSNNAERSKTFMSLGFNDTKGIIKGSDYKRISFLINSDTRLSDKFSVQLKSNAGYSNRIGQSYGVGQGASAGITNRILTSRPIGGTASDISDPLDASYVNPVKFIDLTDKSNSSLTTLVNLTLNYKVTRYLTFKVLGGGYITNSRNRLFQSKEITNSANSNGLSSIGSALTTNWINENTLTYNRKFSNHSINALAGFTQQQNTNESNFVQVTNFALDVNGVNAIQDGLSASSYGSNKTRWALRSFLGRVNYGYKDRYQLTASLRADGSSKFYGKNKYSFFPAAAFAWQVGEEKLIKDLNVFDGFKLRLSYGRIGNQSIEPYSALSRATSISYFSGRTEYRGNSTASIANRDLRWEQSETSNIGLDMSFFKSRVNFTADAYIKNTKDLLLESPVAGSSGFSTIFQNVGSIRNKGIELVLGTINIKNKNFTWSTDINYNINRNNVSKLGTQEQILSGLVINSSVPPNIIRVGLPLGSLYGYIHDGVYQLSDFEAGGTTLKAGIPVFGVPMAGNFKFRDISGPTGKPDGKVDAYDRAVIGNANPKNFGGINNSFTYKRITFSAFLSWQYGNDILNSSNSLMSGAGYNNLRADYFHSMWTLDRQDTNIPNFSDISGRNVQSSYYIKDGSFLRLQNVAFKYSFPTAFIRRIGMSYFDVTFSADNLVLFTNYDGYDPEVTSTDPGNIGVDYFSYPRPKTYTVGFNVRF